LRGSDNAEWVQPDINIVVHVFQKQIREYYNMRLWGDAKVLKSKTNTKEYSNGYKDNNNPNPNKFKVSPWLVYTAILLVSFS
jgi:hypothetical protein